MVKEKNKKDSEKKKKKNKKKKKRIVLSDDEPEDAKAEEENQKSWSLVSGQNLEAKLTRLMAAKDAIEQDIAKTKLDIEGKQPSGELRERYDFMGFLKRMSDNYGGKEVDKEKASRQVIISTISQSVREAYTIPGGLRYVCAEKEFTYDVKMVIVSKGPGAAVAVNIVDRANKVLDLTFTVEEMKSSGSFGGWVISKSWPKLTAQFTASCGPKIRSFKERQVYTITKERFASKEDGGFDASELPFLDLGILYCAFLLSPPDDW
jgi:hypothetical protein